MMRMDSPPKEKKGFFGKIASKLGLGAEKKDKAKKMKRKESDDYLQEEMCMSAAPRMM